MRFGKEGVSATSKRKAKQQAGYPEDLATATDEGAYSKQQILRVGEKVYVGRRCHLGTFIARKEEVTPGFEASRDRLALLLAASAAR